MASEPLDVSVIRVELSTRMTDVIKRLDVEIKIKMKTNCLSTQMYAKTKQQEKHLKNVCAVSSFIQVLLTKGYSFNEHSFPHISFQKKVRRVRVNIKYKSSFIIC